MRLAIYQINLLRTVVMDQPVYGLIRVVNSRNAFGAHHQNPSYPIYHYDSQALPFIYIGLYVLASLLKWVPSRLDVGIRTLT